MLFHQIIILSLIQGLTEFLPISSSGHLIIIPKLFGWPDQGLLMDVAVHIGTLLAVILYFRKDVAMMFTGFFRLAFGKIEKGGVMALFMIIGTVPAVIGGLLLSHYGISFRYLSFIGWTTLIYGILLGIVDKICRADKTLKDMTWWKALLVGIAQAMALLPGTSRSGACMTMGRMLGMKRQDAAKFAFLLSIPAIAAAGVHTGLKSYVKGQIFFTSEVMLAIASSFIFGLIAVNFMMRWLQKGGFAPFVWYRIALGSFLIWYASVNM